VSLQQGSSGKYWNGSSFSSSTEVLLDASGTTSWSYAFASGNFPADGSYTIRARSTDNAGNFSGFESVTFTMNAPPHPVAGGPYRGNEGSAIPLSGASDVSTNSWSYEKVANVDVGATCGFSNASSLTSTFTCTDDGTYRVILTSNDGTNPAVTSTALVTVDNVPPQSVKITSPTSGTSTVVGVTIQLSASFTDPAVNDNHTCVVSWGDGQASGTITESGGSGKCTASHKYAAKGTYSVSVSVTDDDGGVGTSLPITINVK
jgi:hypothetical protein